MKSRNDTFYKTLLSLGIPVTIQNTITSSLNLVDMLMIGQLGTNEVAAVGLANRFYFVFILITFALSSGTAIFTAQFWGKKDIQNIGKVMGIALILSMIVSFVFTIVSVSIPGFIMGVFTEDSHVIAEGIPYLRIVGLTHVMMALAMLYIFVLRSTGHVMIPTFIIIGALSLNTFLNYCLILGHFGFPAMGVKGAAIATLISRFFEAGLIVLISHLKNYPVVRLQDLRQIPGSLIRQFIKTVLPVIGNEFFWVAGVTAYAVVYGRMGTSEIAAVNIIQPVEQFCTSFFFGLASAASVMIGNKIGAGHGDIAISYARRFSIIGVVGAIGAGVVIFISGPAIVSIYQVSETVRSYAVNMLMILSVLLWIRIFNLIAVVGVLRGGGDTTFSFYMEMINIWVVGVPLALLGGFVWKIPVYWVYALVQIEELSKMVFGIYRIVSQKWIHSLVDLTER